MSDLTLFNIGYGNLVAADRVEVGVCYDDAALDEGVVIDGSTTDATHYMRLTVADQARHKGKAGAGVVLKPSKVKGHAIAIKDDNLLLWTCQRQSQCMAGALPHRSGAKVV